MILSKGGINLKLKVVKQIKLAYAVFAEPGDIIEYKCGMVRNGKTFMVLPNYRKYTKVNIFQRILLRYL